MSKTSVLSVLIFVGAGAIAVTGCTRDATGPDGLRYMTAVTNEVNNIFLPTYDSLATRSARLATQLVALQAAPTADGLTAAQTTWRQVRASYEFNEAFGYGPVETDGVDPAVDSWPVDVQGIDAVIASTDSLTPDYIHALPVTLKGTHGVEYVLFGAHNDATAASLTGRQLDYLVAAAQDVANEMATLQQAWSPSSGNYAGTVIHAGQAGDAYATSAAALQDIVSQMAGQPGQILSKFAQPLATDSAIYEESQFSDNTLGDIQSNIQGTAALYYGGLGAIVAAKDPVLDATVRQQIAAAETAINAITPSFAGALQSDTALLVNAENAVYTLQVTMVRLVAPLLGDGNAPPLGPQQDND